MNRMSLSRAGELNKPGNILKTNDLESSRKKNVQHQIRLPMAKVDHFIDFVNRPYFYQDVAYGTRVIKLETGEKLAMPNVVRP